MAKYQLLKTFKYGPTGRQHLTETQVEQEYQSRLNGYSTMTTRLFPQLVNKTMLELGLSSHRSTGKAQYPIFWVVTPAIHEKQSTLMRFSAAINALLNTVPRVAVESYLRSLLTNEIFFTNEIEGVHTNPEEIGTIVWEVNDKSKPQNRRLESTIRQYNAALKADQKQIKQLQDFRKIYDQLLAGEIKPDQMPDGKLFRNRFVYIGREGSAAHLPPDNEKAIQLALNQLITFMNDDSYTPVDKALVTHFMFENTHPFLDGNGRTGRYLLSSYLSKKVDPFTGLSLSTAIHNHVQTYYRLFKEAGDIENRADLTYFIEGMLDIIISGQQEVVQQLRSRLDSLNRNFDHLKKAFPTLSSDEESILFLLLQSKLFTSGPKNGIQDRELRQIAKESGNISRRRFGEIIDDLIEQNIIVTISKNPLQHVINDRLISLGA